ncbi:MAG TPA: trehalose-6-phosphate synthase [Gaiellaceae bacterium]|nr:trehalose-6-phosphate synthase [Gaiellaceae bacterium]
MAFRRQLIVVSNRGPVTYDRDANGQRIAKRGGGGLVTALRGLLEHHDVTWIASAATDEDRRVAEEGNGEVVLLAHDPQVYDRYYNVVANPMLWFVQHSLWGRVLKPTVDEAFHEAWRDYEQVNRTFADAVVAQLDNTPDAAVFFHDYHLYLAPRLVRTERPDAVLAHFVHIPWPVDWTVLPRDCRRAVHEGLLANDVVAFHTARWARNFERSCAETVGGCGTTHVRHHAISIDTGEFDELRTSPEVRAEEEKIVATRPEKLVLRVDRTDPSKNVVRGFVAFGLLLDAHPEWRDRVRMLALLDPSRQKIPEYVEYLEAVERTVAEVNDRHPGSIELRVADNFPQSVAAYKQFDVLLVNAVYDGMNLVAKEAPLVNERGGVLVLSENAGAHEELAQWCLTVNPIDVWEQAEALHEALLMDEGERRRRLEAIQEHVRVNDVRAWIDGLLADLDAVTA